MIINNNFKVHGNPLQKNSKLKSIEEEKVGLKKSIDNLNERYKKGEIDIDKFKKIANNYATQQENLNKQSNKYNNR